MRNADLKSKGESVMAVSCLPSSGVTVRVKPPYLP